VSAHPCGCTGPGNRCQNPELSERARAEKAEAAAKAWHEKKGWVTAARALELMEQSDAALEALVAKWKAAEARVHPAIVEAERQRDEARKALAELREQNQVQHEQLTEQAEELGSWFTERDDLRAKLAAAELARDTSVPPGYHHVHSCEADAALARVRALEEELAKK
jgi:chromosome segregation ATPase